MNYTRKLASLLLALVMVFSLAVTAFAQDVAVGESGNGSITISNAAKGETYKIYKLFDAKINGEESIAYTGEIPESLNTYFEKDTAGNIKATAAAKNGETEMSEALKSALKTWADTATELKNAEAEGGELKFTNLAYGYYVITSTQGNGTAVSVDSTRPTATVIDKNATVPVLTKTADGESYSIGDTITYTLSFEAANFDGEASINQYTIHDTLPEFLSDVKVTKIMIGTTEYKQNGTVPQFDQTTKQIEIPWVDDDGKHIYNNGVTVTITYTATLTDEATIGGEGNTNTATLTYSNKSDTATDTVYSYSFDVVKTDSNKKVLTGAKFELFDAQTAGNKIALVKESDGVYRVATDDEKNAERGFTSAVIEAGKATIKGLKAGTYWLEETEAPAGYNKLTERQQVTIDNTNLDATVNDTTYTSGGVQVINNAGTQLPSTGGVGTTIFYVLGSVLVLAAVVLLVTKKRMGTEG